MLGLFGNLAPWELIVIAVVAVIAFGKSLPQVAARAYMQLRRLRRAMEQMRRESGIDRELRSIEHSMREAERAALEAGRTADVPGSDAPDAERRATAAAAGDAGQAPAEERGAESREPR